MGGPNKVPDKVNEVAPQYRPCSVLLTYEDYCRMPAGQRYELVEGDIRMTPSPTVSHQRISKRLLLALVEWIEGRGLGVVYNAPKDGELATQQVYPIGTTLTSPLLPGFVLDVEAIFR